MGYISSLTSVCLFFLGYIVKKKKKGSPNWEPVTAFPVDGTQCTVPNLDEGEEYEFKVCAVTDAGPGDDSLATAPVKVEDPNGELSNLSECFWKCTKYLIQNN